MKKILALIMASIFLFSSIAYSTYLIRPLKLGSGTITVDQILEYFDATGSSGFFYWRDFVRWRLGHT